MKQIKKILASVLVFAMVISMITACGKKDAETTTEDGKTIVRFMVNGSAAELEIYQKAIDAFNEQSEKTSVELIGVTGDDYSAQVMTQLQSEEAPDCFYAEEGSYGELNSSGVVADLSDYLNSADSALKMEDIPESILETYTFDGAVTGVPVDCNPEVIYYNEDLFKSLDIKTPTEYMEEGTWNFETFQTVCEQLKDAGKIPFVWENWWGPAYSFLLSNGDSFYTEDGQANINTNRILDGMTFLESNMENGNFIYAGKLESGESADTLFMAGDTGMVYSGRWSVAEYTDLDFTYDVALFPYYKEPKDAVSSMPATPMVMNTKAENPDNVWEFIAFYCGEKGQRIRMEGQGNAVPTIDGLEDIVLTGTPEHAQVFLDAVDISFLYPQVEALHPGLTDILTGEIEKMLAGDQDAATTVKNMQDQAQEMLNE